MEYPKIETLFKRGDDFKVNPAEFKSPIYSMINPWRVSEKLDGTNMRVYLKPDSSVKIGGRSDNADIKGDLVNWIYKTLPVEKLQSVLWKEENTILKPEIVLYGEGVGAGIQKGGAYSKEKIFVLFDVLIDNMWWLNYDAVIQIATDLGIKHAPDLGVMPLAAIIDLVRKGFQSPFASTQTGISFPAEGIVGRPLETLYDKNKNRIILKLKTTDF